MYSNPYLYTDQSVSNALPVSVMPQGGIYIRDDNDVKQVTFRGTANYNKVWNDTHIFNGLIGMEANRSDYDAQMHQDYGVDYDNGREVIITPLFYKMAKEQGTALTSFSRTWDRRLAYFANANYSYKGRYSFNVTGRYDGSNQLGKSRSARWLPTWNVSGAWNAHEEEFFKKWMERTHGAMSNATLRLSYSLVGERGSASNALPIYMAYQPFRPLANDAETGIELYSLGNSEPDLREEEGVQRRC